MSTITRELAKLFRKITNSEIDAEGNAHVVLSPADSLLINNARIALASLEAEQVAYIFKHPAGKLFWALTDESNKDQSDVIPVYAASPAPIASEAIENAIEYIRSIVFHIDEDDYHGKHIAYFMRQALAWLEGHSCSDDSQGKSDNSPLPRYQVIELTMLVKQLVSQLKKAKPDCKLPDRAMDYLLRNGLVSAEGGLTMTISTKKPLYAEVHNVPDDYEFTDEELNRIIAGDMFTPRQDAIMAREIQKLRAAMLHGAEPVKQTYKLPELIEGMEVSIDVSTCDADLGNRYFGTVTEALELDTAKNGYILLVQDAEPNFDVNGNSPGTPDSWISCSDQMPEKGQNVLISVNFDSSLVEPLICSARYTGSTFRRGDATIKPGNGIEQATHWMPLPAAPQQEVK